MRKIGKNLGKSLKNFGTEAKKTASKYNPKALLVEAGDNIKQAPIKALAYRNELKAEVRKGRTGNTKKVLSNIIQGGTGINVLAGTESSINAGTATDIQVKNSFVDFVMSGFGLSGPPKKVYHTYQKEDLVGSVSSSDKQMWSGQNFVNSVGGKLKGIFKK